MKKELAINGRKIGPSEPPYIVAELSANHNGSLKRTLNSIKAARESGADAVKIQTFTADTITIDHKSEEFMIRDGLWDGRYLYDLYSEAQLPLDWHQRIFEFAEDINITVFSSPFDATAVDFLEGLNAPAYKIASFEIVDLELIARAARTHRPMIISTGLADQSEIQLAVNTAYENECKDLILLHCISGYPAPSDQYNLRTMVDMADRFSVLTGLSDHTIGNTTAIAAVALGANIIEKHFTLDHDSGGVDESFSINPHQLSRLCEDARVAWESLGQIKYSRAPAEIGNLKFRRSLYVVQDISKGETLTRNNIRCIRPGYGMKPSRLPEVLGKKANRSLSRGTPLKPDHFS